MSDRPDLSIVIVGRDEGELLEACLASLPEGTEGVTSETLYIDNGSAPGLLDRVREGFREVVVVENGANLGFARANDRGIARSRGRYVLLLNNDARLRPGSMRRVVDHLDRNPETGALGCRLVSEEGRVQHSVHSFPDLPCELLNRSLLSLLFPLLRVNCSSG